MGSLLLAAGAAGAAATAAAAASASATLDVTLLVIAATGCSVRPTSSTTCRMPSGGTSAKPGWRRRAAPATALLP